MASPPETTHLCDISSENDTNGYPFEQQNRQLLNGRKVGGQAILNGYHEQVNGLKKTFERLAAAVRTADYFSEQITLEVAVRMGEDFFERLVAAVQMAEYFLKGNLERLKNGKQTVLTTVWHGNSC